MTTLNFSHSRDGKNELTASATFHDEDSVDLGRGRTASGYVTFKWDDAPYRVRTHWANGDREFESGQEWRYSHGHAKRDDGKPLTDKQIATFRAACLARVVASVGATPSRGDVDQAICEHVDSQAQNARDDYERELSRLDREHAKAIAWFADHGKFRGRIGEPVRVDA